MARRFHRIIGHGGDTQYFHSDLHLFLDESEGPRELLTIPTCAHAVLDVVYFSTVPAVATWLMRSTTIRLVIDDFAEDGLELLEHEYAGAPITERAWPSREHALERLQVHRQHKLCKRAPARSSARSVTELRRTRAGPGVRAPAATLPRGEYCSN